MWGWILLLWCAAAVGVAWVYGRLRRSDRRLTAEVRAFLDAFADEAGSHPGVEVAGMLPRRLTCLLRVDGQETPVALHDLLRREQAFPGSLPRAVDELIAEIREVGLDRIRDHEWGGVAPSILPQIKHREFVERQGRFGDGAIVHRPLIDDLVIVYVIDDADAMVFVCRAHLQQWRRSEEDVHQLALTNLSRRAGLAPAVAASGEPTLLQTGDGYDAARVLTLDRADGLLVAMPDRDVLWVAREIQGQDLAQLERAAQAMAAAAPHPVSDRVFRITAGRLEPLRTAR